MEKNSSEEKLLGGHFCSTYHCSIEGQQTCYWSFHSKT